jgi:hypothetical protein
VLASAHGGFSAGTWNRDGVILYSPVPTKPILRVSAAGGEPAAATRIEEGLSLGHSHPTFLPDGNHFFYTSEGTGGSGVYIGQLDHTDVKHLMNDAVAPIYLSSGYILFSRQGVLFAQNLIWNDWT